MISGISSNGKIRVQAAHATPRAPRNWAGGKFRCDAPTSHLDNRFPPESARPGGRRCIGLNRNPTFPFDTAAREQEDIQLRAFFKFKQWTSRQTY